MNTNNNRLVGLILSWTLSQNGGYGAILHPNTNERFFCHRRFIQQGDPIPGCVVEFTPAPALQGKPNRRALDAVVHPPDKRVSALKALNILTEKHSISKTSKIRRSVETDALKMLAQKPVQS